MAITITDQPTNFARVGQKLMVVATSTNVGQPNFRFVVRIFNETFGQVGGDLIVPPNPSNRLMVDIRDLVKPELLFSVYNPNSERNYINSSIANVETELANLISHFTIKIYEGYDVDGVFTIDAETEISTSEKVILRAHHKISDGYKPDPNLTYSLTSTTSLLMGSRKPTTHYHNGSVNITHSNQRVIIPVRRSELDWGTLVFIAQDAATDILTTTDDPVLRMTLFESDGTPNTASYTSYVNMDINFVGAYPANLNAHGELLRPADFPNWRYYDIAIYDSANSSRKSALYTFYPVDDDCRFDNVRLAWWDDEVGGFDFFNFTKKNEQSVEVERKRVKSVVGSYAAASFTFNNFDSELKEGFIDAVDYIDITSDWIQEGEFELLKHLVRSEAVYIVGDDGTLTPVLVENSSYTAKKERSAKLYNQTFRLRYSQQQIR